MTTEMSVKEFWEILGKLDNTTVERIVGDNAFVSQYVDGNFQFSIGNHIIKTVDMRGAKFAVDVMLGMPEGYSKKLIDDLREAVDEEEEEPELDEDGYEEGIMQLAELFEEED